MTSFGDRYILSSGNSGHDRLRMLCEIHDPGTRELLLRAGIGSQRRYVEFGCGLGYVARWAASQVERVTAIDLSQEHLGEASRLAREDGIENLEFRNASIYEHGLEPAAFDIAYSRWLLVHLNKPVEAMRQIHQALKPGGTMVCEEVDVSAVYTEPPTAYHDFRDLAMEVGEKRGVDYAGGRRLHTWAREAGFDVIEASAYQPHHVSGPHKSFWSWTFLETAPAMLAGGFLTEERLAELRAGMHAADRDPRVLVAHARNHQLIARKPLAG